MDLDDEELEATRRLYGVSRDEINVKEGIKLMNNIEILEEMLNADKYLGKFLSEPRRKAIENLIQENKELKEEKQLAYKLGYRNGCNDTTKFNDKEFIRKTKVKEKIEYLKSLEFGSDLVTQSTANLTTISILQELLEEI